MPVTYPEEAFAMERGEYERDRERRKAAADEALQAAEAVLQEATNALIVAERAVFEFDQDHRWRVSAAKAELTRLLDEMPAAGVESIAWEAVPALCEGTASVRTLTAVAAAWAVQQPGFGVGLLAVLDGPEPDGAVVSRLSDEEHARERQALLSAVQEAKPVEFRAQAARDEAAAYAQRGWERDAEAAHRDRLSSIAVGSDL